MAIVTSADLHSAIVALWDAGTLNAAFEDLWAVADRALFEALNDTMAAPGNPFPYCVFEILPGTTTGRMSGNGPAENHELRDIPLTFTVYARELVGDSRTAKRIAADLATEIMAIYGGHPTISPTAMTLINGSVLINQYQTDYGVRTGDEEHSWVISYLPKLDVQMAI